MTTSALLREIRKKYAALQGLMSERARRVWASVEARSLGHGGIIAVSRATGLAERTVRNGLAELQRSGQSSEVERVRRYGGGRKSIQNTVPEILEALESLVAPSARGDPMSPLRWTCKSTRKLSDELVQQGHPVGYRTVARLLGEELDYSLQSTRKTKEGRQHPDRDGQFLHINQRVKTFLKQNQPVISIDCKKKEKIGDFANAGHEYRPQGRPEKASAHDFAKEKAIPFGIYDLARNTGWVNVGTDHETAQFAVESIRRWWRYVGRISCAVPCSLFPMGHRFPGDMA